MADDDGNDGPGTPDPPPGWTMDDLKAAVREVMAEGKVGDPPKPDDPDRPATIRDLEAFAEKVTEQAMEVLRSAAAKPKAKPKGSDGADGDDKGTTGTDGGTGSGNGAPPKAKPTPEPVPATSGDLTAKVRKFLFGDLGA